MFYGGLFLTWVCKQSIILCKFLRLAPNVGWVCVYVCPNQSPGYNVRVCTVRVYLSVCVCMQLPCGR